jgi:ATP-dependent DNA ligase
VAIDPKTGKLLPFQILSTRKRKAESEADIKVRDLTYISIRRNTPTQPDAMHVHTPARMKHEQVQVIVYAFDILYLNDRPVLQEPLIQRRCVSCFILSCPVLSTPLGAPIPRFAP